MATRAPFLKTRYGGYFHRDIPEEDAELTHVGPGTPCGEYLRRFWQPVCFSDELKDLPLRLKIIGEDLVAFRDKSGAVGLLELHCPHRGTSLEFGLVGDKGIRCCYHGWLFGVDGTILETPGEPADSTLKDRLFHGAYPIHEYNGDRLCLYGPARAEAALPGLRHLRPAGLPDDPWAEILSFRRTGCRSTKTRWTRSTPRFCTRSSAVRCSPKSSACCPSSNIVETPVGMVYVGTRRIGDNVWTRMVEVVLPNLQQVAPIWETGREECAFSGPMMTRWAVPIDDTNTMLIEFRHVCETDGTTTPEWWADRNIMLPGQLAADSYEEGQLHPGDYEAQVSQRPIAIHGLEHLSETDRGVSMFRNQIRRGIRAVAAGDDPMGLFRNGAGVDPDLLQQHGHAHAGRRQTPAMDKQLMRRNRAPARRKLPERAAADGRPLRGDGVRPMLRPSDRGRVGLTSRNPPLYVRGIPENVGKCPGPSARARTAYRDNNNPKRNPNSMSSKRQEPKYKINRRLGVNLWGRPKSPLNRREYGPGQHGQRRKKPSDFGTQLAAKQKLKGYYANLGERQFRRLYEEAVRRRGDTGDNLIELLERRLDAVVYRMKLVPTPFAARQLVNHGHVRVNGKRVNIPSYSVRDGDEIELGAQGQGDGAGARSVADRASATCPITSRSTTTA